MIDTVYSMHWYSNKYFRLYELFETFIIRMFDLLKERQNSIIRKKKTEH